MKKCKIGGVLYKAGNPLDTYAFQDVADEEGMFPSAEFVAHTGKIEGMTALFGEL